MIKIVALLVPWIATPLCLACGSSSNDASTVASGGASGGSSTTGGASTGGNGGISIGGAFGGGAGDVEAVVTCDNAYGFGWGDGIRLNNYRAAPASVTAGDIFGCNIGPEGYTVPAVEAPESAYLYAVAWADHRVTQGLIGQFKRSLGAPIYSGDPRWEVCATGIDYDSGDPIRKAGPSIEQVNGEITKCNAGTGDRAASSAGWVNTSGAVTSGAIGNLAIGQDNSTAYNPDFPIACPSGGTYPGLDSQARWMWYSSTGSADAFSFVSLQESRPFLIFRLPAMALPPPR